MNLRPGKILKIITYRRGTSFVVVKFLLFGNLNSLDYLINQKPSYPNHYTTGVFFHRNTIHKITMNSACVFEGGLGSVLEQRILVFQLGSEDIIRS